MMWGTCALVWIRFGTLGVGGTLGDEGNTLGSDGGETVEVTGGETDAFLPCGVGLLRPNCHT